MYIEEDNYIVNKQNNYLTAGIFSTVGGRENQQDSAGYSIGDDKALFVVCDGMGGHKDGKRASQTAVTKIISHYESSDRNLMDAVIDIDLEINSWVDADGNPLQSGTTLALITVDKNELNWISVGDSRIYLYRAGEMVRITKDHIYEVALKENREAGLISNSFYQQEKDSSDVLISFLGVGGLPLVDSNSSPFKLQKDDRVIVMTDGLYKNIPDALIRKCIQNFNDPTDMLRAIEYQVNKVTVKESIVRDNMTVAIIKIK